MAVIFGVILVLLIILISVCFRDGEDVVAIALIFAVMLDLIMLSASIHSYKTELEDEKGVYKIEIKGLYKDSLFVRSDTIITLK